MAIVKVITMDKALGLFSNRKKEKINTAQIQYAEVSFDQVDFWQKDDSSAAPFSAGFVNEHVVALRQEEHGLAAALQRDPSFNAYKTARGTGLYIRQGLVKEIVLTDKNTGTIKLTCGKTTPAIDFSVSSDDVHFEAPEKLSIVENITGAYHSLKAVGSNLYNVLRKPVKPNAPGINPNTVKPKLRPSI